MTESITFWLHMLAATVWVGPQLFLFVASVPAVRLIEDRETRARVMRLTAYRFGYLAAAAMIVLVLSGISNLFQEGADADTDLSSFDNRYAWVFLAKMILVGLTVVFTAVHALVIGPRLLALQGSASEDGAATRLKVLSVASSALNLVLAIAIIYVAALLANHAFSFKPV